MQAVSTFLNKATQFVTKMSFQEAIDHISTIERRESIRNELYALVEKIEKNKLGADYANSDTKTRQNFRKEAIESTVNFVMNGNSSAFNTLNSQRAFATFFTTIANSLLDSSILEDNQPVKIVESSTGTTAYITNKPREGLCASKVITRQSKEQKIMRMENDGALLKDIKFKIQQANGLDTQSPTPIEPAIIQTLPVQTVETHNVQYTQTVPHMGQPVFDPLNPFPPNPLNPFATAPQHLYGNPPYQQFASQNPMPQFHPHVRASNPYTPQATNVYATQLQQPAQQPYYPTQTHGGYPTQQTAPAAPQTWPHDTNPPVNPSYHYLNTQPIPSNPQPTQGTVPQPVFDKQPWPQTTKIYGSKQTGYPEAPIIHADSDISKKMLNEIPKPVTPHTARVKRATRDESEAAVKRAMGSQYNARLSIVENLVNHIVGGGKIEEPVTVPEWSIIPIPKSQVEVNFPSHVYLHDCAHLHSGIISFYEGSLTISSPSAIGKEMGPNAQVKIRFNSGATSQANIIKFQET